MRRISMVCATLVTVAVLAPNQKAMAGSGDVAVGLLGGLAAGTIIGSAFAPRVYYYEPAPYPVEMEVEAPPMMMAPSCYWTRGAPVWDSWRGVWVRPRIQVCN
jgi:hypothetical protein